MSELEWTDEPPEETGFYWVRTSRIGSLNVAFVYDITPPEYRNDEFWVDVVGSDAPKELEDCTGMEWAGPIPEPTDPDA